MSDFWRLGMESQAKRDERTRARVAMTSIYASRLVDDFNNPNLMIVGQPYPGSIETRVGPMHAPALADMKGTAPGMRSSFEAAHYYMDKTIQRRNELLAKAAAEKASSASSSS